jgi:hypothetical protein
MELCVVHSKPLLQIFLQALSTDRFFNISFRLDRNINNQRHSAASYYDFGRSIVVVSISASLNSIFCRFLDAARSLATASILIEKSMANMLPVFPICCAAVRAGSL